MQIKSLSSLGWFLSLGTFGQLFAALVVVYKLVINPWKGAVTEVVHNGKPFIIPSSRCVFIAAHASGYWSQAPVSGMACPPEGCAMLRGPPGWGVSHLSRQACRGLL